MLPVRTGKISAHITDTLIRYSLITVQMGDPAHAIAAVNIQLSSGVGDKIPPEYP